MTTALEQGAAAQKAGRIPQAIAAYRASLAEAPSHVAAHNLGVIHADRNEWRPAAEMLALADRLRPDQVPTLTLLGYVQSRLLQLDEGERLYRRALARDPENLLAHGRLALNLLAQGRFAEAWPHWDRRSTRVNSPLLKSGLPEWRGEPLAGRDLILWGEQGLGDEIQIARYIPRLKAMGCGRLVVACQPANVRALSQLGADEAVSRFEPLRVSTPHLWAMFWSLPGLLGVTREALDGRAYLNAQATPRRGGVGLALSGNPDNPVDRLRSLPDDRLARRIPGAIELKPSGDVADSLAMIAGLDLVITVDTSWAHMAGALGVPCWVLIARDAADWRWFPAESERTPWYASLRLFWQPAPGDWDGVIETVASELAALRIGSAGA